MISTLSQILNLLFILVTDGEHGAVCVEKLLVLEMM